MELVTAARMQWIFQFTPLREGRPPTCLNGKFLFMNFNSRPYARGDEKQAVKRPIGKLFQFTPLREGRRARHEEFCKSYKFQFTPLRERRRLR